MAAPAIAPVNTAGNIDSILKLIQGGTDLFKGSSTTQTAASNISQQGTNQLIQQILASTQGLGAVAGAQKGAGLYNSTTNRMLTNDLISRAAGEVEMRRAGTTTTTKKNPQLGGSDILSLLASAAAGKVLGPVAKKAGQSLGLDSLGQKLADAVFGGSSGYSVATSNIGTSGVATDLLGNVVGAGSAGLDALTSAGSSIAGSFLADAAGSAGLAALGSSWAPAALGLGEIAGASANIAGVAELASTVLPGVVEGATAVAGAAEGAGILATLAEVGGWIASLFSDERLKTDIKPVGKTNDGQNIYTYKYIDNPHKTHMGVLAQETLKTHPEAVSTHPIGALMVDYSKLT